MADDGADRSVEAGKPSREFSLLGGPFHRLGCRVGLVRRGMNTVPLGLAIGLFLWGVLVLLGALQGIGHAMFSLSLIAGHVRLLVAIPLFFVCEAYMAPRIAAFIAGIVRSGIVPEGALPALDRSLRRFGRLRDSWLVEAFLLAVAVLLSWGGTLVELPGTSTAYDPAKHGEQITLAGRWYWFVCLPVFRFLILRWLWRIALWCLFLRRLVRLELHLIPTHPDGAAGLGGLELVHAHFTPLAAAISAVISASFAEEMAAGTRNLASLYPAIGLIVLLDAVLFMGPLCMVASRLWACKLKGLGEYMGFATRYVTDFDTRWLRSESSSQESPLGTADLQSLADLGNSVAVVRSMRWIPLSWQLVRNILAAAILPLLPLLLFEYPVGDLIQTLFKAVSGL